MENLVIEFEPLGQPQLVLDAARALEVTPDARLGNLSELVGHEIWIMQGPNGFDQTLLATIPGMIRFEGDAEHPFYGIYDTYASPFGRSDTVVGPFTRFLGMPVQSSLTALPEIMEITGADRALQNNDGSGAILAIMDSGVDGTRVPTGMRAGGWTDDPGSDPWTDEFGHGTMVALIASAYAPGAKIFSLKPKTTPSQGIRKMSVLKALDELLGIAIENPDLRFVLNNSWGLVGCLIPPMAGNCDFIPEKLIEAIDGTGMVLTVFAAGNAHQDCGGKPAIWRINSTAWSTSVGALRADLLLQAYSSRGPGDCFAQHPTVVAPTYGILPWRGGYRDFGPEGGGTSACAPQVAGAMALMITAAPGATNQRLRSVLAATADNPVLGRAPGWNPESGHGLLQVDRAVALL